MERDIRQWAFHNVSEGTSLTPLLSISQAIEVLVDVSKKEIGETIYFKHSHRGLICCTAGKERSSLSFHPRYNKSAHSLVGNREALSNDGSQKLPHIDSVGCLGYIPGPYVLPLLEVVLGLVSILETHSFPEFLRWTDPVPSTV